MNLKNKAQSFFVDLFLILILMIFLYKDDLFIKNIIEWRKDISNKLV